MHDYEGLIYVWFCEVYENEVKDMFEYTDTVISSPPVLVYTRQSISKKGNDYIESALALSKSLLARRLSCRRPLSCGLVLVHEREKQKGREIKKWPEN